MQDGINQKQACLLLTIKQWISQAQCFSAVIQTHYVHSVPLGPWDLGAKGTNMYPDIRYLAVP